MKPWVSSISALATRLLVLSAANVGITFLRNQEKHLFAEIGTVDNKMIIDKVNFEKELPNVFEAIQKMSGIKTDEKINQLDLPGEHYYKLRSASSKYGIIQIGICTFRKTDEGLLAHPYNFYVFPRVFQGKFNRDIAINNDCMDFHETINTDINRWIYKGVTYIQQFDYEKMKKAMQEPEAEEKTDGPAKDTSESLSESDKETLDRIKKDYATFCQEAADGAEFSMLVSKGAVRKCFYQVIEEQTPNHFTSTKDAAPNNWREKTITVKKTTKEEKEAIKKDIEKKKEEEFNASVGFVKVWLELMNYKKPVVGHNCFMDLMFVFEHFHKNNPQQYKRYKESLKETWPQVYDTKVLASEMKVEGMGSFMNLEELYGKLCDTTNIKIACAEGLTNYAEKLTPEQLKEKGAESGFHSAGYDAFVTGSCFYMMSKLSDGTATMENFRNKIRLGGNRLFMADLGNLDGDEDISDKAYLVVVTERSKEVDKAEQQKIQKEILESIKEEIRKTANYSFQFSPNGLYGKRSFVNYFFGFDKKFLPSMLSVQNDLKTHLKNQKVENLGVFTAEGYQEFMDGVLKEAGEKGGYQGSGHGGNHDGRGRGRGGAGKK